MREKGSTFLIAIFSGVIALSFYAGGIFSGLDRFFSDRLQSKVPMSDDIVVVSIDNDSLAKIGSWPWPRAVFAEFLKKTSGVSPKAIALDVTFADASRYGNADDIKLEKALSSIKIPIIFPVEANPLLIKNSSASASSFVVPLSRFLNSGVRLGHVNIIKDPDGIVRKVPTSIVGPEGKTIVSFASASTEILREGISRIAFAGPGGTVHSVPFFRVLEDEALRATLSGKYLFVGATAPDLHDEADTPFSRGITTSGVEIHAQIANMLLSGARVRLTTPVESFFWIMLLAIVASSSFIFIKSARYAILLSGISWLSLIVLTVLIADKGVLVPFIHGNLAFLGAVAGSFSYRYSNVENDRRKIRHTFGKYVSREVLEEMLSNPEKVRLGGEEKFATIFFSDVRGFTTLSEKLSPSELVKFLNGYLTRMTDIALSHGGVVDKYIGDAIMAFWGAPLVRPTHAIDAVHATLAMCEALDQFNSESVSRGDLSIDIGIGLNSGPVVAGNMGSEQRFDYTVMGDTVNLASRLESQTKNYGVRIIVAESVIDAVGREVLSSEGIFFREVDRIKVKGKTKAVSVYEIIENSKKANFEKIKDDFEIMREVYYSGNWKEVVFMAKEILAKVDDGPTKTLASRAENFLSNPPNIWEGVYEMKTK